MNIAIGESNGAARLSEAQVAQILLDERSDTAIAKVFHVSRKCVAKIKSGKTWGHVMPELSRRNRHLAMSLNEAIDRLSMPEPNTGCFIWMGALQGDGYQKGKGYGVLSFQGRRISAHRAAYEAVNGAIPDGLFVMHKCDNTLCCNPAHLTLGTHQDNVDDCVSKGRHTQGESHPMAKLSASQVSAIRSDRRPVEDVSSEFGISRAQVYHIRNNSRWRAVA